MSTGGSDAYGTIAYTYRPMAGTSMAMPHVVGVAALMKAVNPALTPDQFDALLARGDLTIDLGTPGRDDYYGYGLIDARKAVQAAMTGTQPPVSPHLVVAPASLNFGDDTTVATVALSNDGGGSLSVNPPTDDATWLSVSPAQAGNPMGAYVVTVNRSGLGAGTYSATITFSSSANTVSVPVIMQVTNHPLFGDAGYHYVLLIDSASGETVDQFEAQASNGVYAYRFVDVAPGRYEIFAGTDANNDTYICDPGEACGGYTTLDQPKDLDVSDSLSGLDFSTGFELSVPAAADTGAPQQSHALRRHH